MWGVVGEEAQWLSWLPCGGQWGGLGGEGGELGKRTSESCMSQHRVPGLQHAAIQQVSSIWVCFCLSVECKGGLKLYWLYGVDVEHVVEVLIPGSAAGPLGVPDYIQPPDLACPEWGVLEECLSGPLSWLILGSVHCGDCRICSLPVLTTAASPRASPAFPGWLF